MPRLREFVLGPWRAVAVLGVTQILAWGTLLIIALDEYLKASGTKWRTPVLAAAVGIYLPLDLTTPIFLGGLLTWFVERRLGVVKDDHDAKDRVHRKGVVFSATSLRARRTCWRCRHPCTSGSGRGWSCSA
jgi:hypothetical protein